MTKYSELNELVQMVEDIKYLTKLNEIGLPLRESAPL
jgi:hypothetical protein